MWRKKYRPQYGRKQKPSRHVEKIHRPDIKRDILKLTLSDSRRVGVLWWMLPGGGGAYDVPIGRSLGRLVSELYDQNDNPTIWRKSFDPKMAQEEILSSCGEKIPARY